MRKVLFLLFIIISITFITCFAASDVQTNFINDRVFANDFFAVGQNISNTSVIQGDMLTIGDTISNTGTVDGDFLGGGSNVYLNGKLLDDVRTFGQNIKIEAQIGKNLNVLGETTQINRDTFIKGDLLAAGSSLNVDGAVNGITYIACNKVELNGTFNNDVFITVLGSSTADNSNPIIIGPNARIKGTLKYTSPMQASVANGAQIGNIQKNIVVPKNTQNINPFTLVRGFVSAVIYSLIGFLIMRLFPIFIDKSRDSFKNKTLSCLGIGILGALSMILSSIITLILFIGIIFTSPVFAFSYMAVSTGIYVALFYLSTIPAALIIGDWAIKGEGRAFIKLTLGVLIISFATLFLDFLNQISSFGTAFGIINVILVLFITFTGFGSLLKAIKRVYKGEEMQTA